MVGRRTSVSGSSTSKQMALPGGTSQKTSGGRPALTGGRRKRRLPAARTVHGRALGEVTGESIDPRVVQGEAAAEVGEPVGVRVQESPVVTACPIAATR